jgi:predicted patatin/cPLA2 family phospholipase
MKNQNYILILVLLIIFVAYTLNTPNNNCRILALSGGGAHGSFEVGIIEKLTNMGYNWDVITGVSVGSINAGLLSMYTNTEQNIAIEKLKSLWFSLNNKKVYTVNLNPIFDGSLYDNKPLYNTLYSILNKYNYTRREIFISATEVNSGYYRTFTNSDMPNTKTMVDIIISSSSIPIYFPPKLMNGKYYMDGGLFSNILIEPAVNYCLKKNKTNIIIDAILASSPLNNVTSSEINKYTIFGTTHRAYELMFNALFNHELYIKCNNGYKMYIYKPGNSLHGGLFDFNFEDIYKNYKIGYNSVNPLIGNYCY